MVTAAGNNAGQSLLSQLLQNAASSLSSTSNTASPDPDADQANSQNGPATNVTLSDSAKAILARAQEAQTVAERLQQAVDRAYGKASSNGTTPSNSLDLTETLQQIASASSQTTGSSQAAGFVPDGQIKPLVSFSNSLQVDGYTISVDADAKNGAANIVINGPNGYQAYDKVDVGGTGEVGGGAYSSSRHNNVEYLTVTDNSAAAQGVAASSSGGSTSAASAQSGSITFAVDFNTGTITAVNSNQSATAALEGTPTSAVTAAQTEQSVAAASATSHSLSAPLSSFL
jgi:hypothetical protein